MEPRASLAKKRGKKTMLKGLHNQTSGFRSRDTFGINQHFNCEIIGKYQSEKCVK